MGGTNNFQRAQIGNNGQDQIESHNFQISINREEKVKNHLTKEVNSNLNLMFYDFNDYG